MSFQKAIAYRFEYFASLLNAFLYIFIFITLWKTLLKEKTNLPFTSEQMTAYVIIAMVIKTIFPRNEGFLTTKVRTGEIAVDLMKPYSLAIIFFSDTIGLFLYQILSKGFPIFLVSYFLFGISFSFDGVVLLKFFLLFGLSFLIHLFISLLISSLSFFFTETFPFWIVYLSLTTLFSGAIIPLDFFPEGMKDLILLTPFPYLFYYPTLVLVKSQSFTNFGDILISYLVQATILFLLSYSLYRLGLRKLTIAGG
ncbi:MAG: ABC-2 family transporter protein [Leptospiraceae bacterium]|nr:ABC-2 family transporter protein [Leptospiraceae bacterium]